MWYERNTKISDLTEKDIKEKAKHFFSKGKYFTNVINDGVVKNPIDDERKYSKEF